MAGVVIVVWATGNRKQLPNCKQETVAQLRGVNSVAIKGYHGGKYFAIWRRGTGRNYCVVVLLVVF